MGNALLLGPEKHQQGHVLVFCAVVYGGEDVGVDVDDPVSHKHHLLSLATCKQANTFHSEICVPRGVTKVEHTVPFQNRISLSDDKLSRIYPNRVPLWIPNQNK